MNYGLDNFEYHRLSEVSFDENQLKPLKVINGQTARLNASAYVDVKIDRGEDADIGLLLRKGEQIQVDCQMEKELTAPVSAGSQIGTIRYLADGEVYRVEYIVTAEDVPSIDFRWCLGQILYRYSL